jgi:hypothetical protein
MGEKPSALFVDDNSDELKRQLNADWPKSLDVPVVRDPSKVTSEHLKDVDVCFVDFDLKEWHDRLDKEGKNESCIATRPKDGHALIAVLRSYVGRDHPVTAFCMLTNKLGEVAVGIPAQRTPYTASRVHGYDWVINKDDANLPGKIEAMVLAAASLNQIKPDDINSIFDWLGPSTPKAVEDYEFDWDEPDEMEASRHFESTKLAIEQCRPPVHDIEAPAHAVVVLRWLLHRILPYPSFLIGEKVLSSRLGIRPSLLADLESVWADLKDCRYSGPGAGLFDIRWWRPEIERLLYSETDGRSLNPDVVRSVIQNRLGGNGEVPLEWIDDAVPVLDPQTLQYADVDTRDACIEVHPDDWPEFADTPWMRIEDAAVMPYLVALEDRARLPESEN